MVAPHRAVSRRVFVLLDDGCPVIRCGRKQIIAVSPNVPRPDRFA
jgi:hypothetical protein